MNSKSWTMVGLTFIVGLVYGVFSGAASEYKGDIISQISSTLGASVGFMIAVLALPFIIGVVSATIKKKFPNDTFVALTMILLAIVGIIMFNN